MMKESLTEEDKKQFPNDSNDKHILLCNKFNCDESQSVEIEYDFAV